MDASAAIGERVTRPWAAPAAAALIAGGCAITALVDPARGPTLCPFKLATGLDCPGCGGTRAAHQLFTGHLGAALDYNVLAVVAIPLILWGLFAWLVRALGGSRVRTWSPSPAWTTVGVVVLLTFWVVRNLPDAPFLWLSSSA